VDIEGLWTAQFLSGTGDTGAGVVVFVGGNIFGGDSGYHYVGGYQLRDQLLTGECTVSHFSGELSSIFGPFRSMKLTLRAAASETLILGSGTAGGVLVPSIEFRLQRVTRLGTGEQRP
jgi:hypothetical protein